MKKEEIQRLHPNLPIHTAWGRVPSGLFTKSQLKAKKQWKEGLEPCAIKSNGLLGNYYFLYHQPAPSQP